YDTRYHFDQHVGEAFRSHPLLEPLRGRNISKCHFLNFFIFKLLMLWIILYPEHYLTFIIL
ncbi:MAG: hypothetical protein ACLUEA_02905, partial [Romboutsia timonensis]